MKTLILGAFVSLFCIGAANAMVTLVAEGTSAKGIDVRFEAEFTIVGDTLTLVLKNTSEVPSENPDDVLGSFYFDIINGGGVRPALTLTDARGDLYNGVVGGADTEVAANADLMNPSSGDNWLFREMDETANPWLGFGVGTVGNSNLGVNGFPGLDGVESAIYAGDIETTALDKGLVLVKDQATFTFSGLTGFTEGDISDQYAFGLGTAPDSLIPEPATLALLGLGGLLLRRRK